MSSTVIAMRREKTCESSCGLDLDTGPRFTCRKAHFARKGKLSIFYEEELDVPSSGLASEQGQ